MRVSNHPFLNSLHAELWEDEQVVGEVGLMSECWV
jgi:hypothetical protein